MAAETPSGTARHCNRRHDACHMIHILDLLGVAVFAVSGALAAGKKKMDLFGVIVVGLVTALGGGTLRDLILGTHPVFWRVDHTYVLVAMGAALLTFVFARHRSPPAKLLLTADALGLAIFTIIGTEKSMEAGTSWVIAVIMGVMTGTAGGIIRDVLSDEIPLILRKEIYATASLCGALVFVGLALFTRNEDISTFSAFAVIFGLRLAAIRWNLSLPIFSSGDRKNTDRENHYE